MAEPQPKVLNLTSLMIPYRCETLESRKGEDGRGGTYAIVDPDLKFHYVSACKCRMGRLSKPN